MWDADHVAKWEVPPLNWIVEDVIQRDALGFLSGPPKSGKSLLALDLCDALTRGASWLGMFRCKAVNVLYIAREDPPRRIKNRLQEISQSRQGARCGKLLFLIRQRMNLRSEDDINRIKEIIGQKDIGLVVLDVVNRMMPGLDENEAKDVGMLVDSMEELRDTLAVTVLAVDHTRKPSGKQQVSPFELKGSMAKYGACDFILCVGRRNHDLELYAENKDLDHSKRFLLTVSTKDATGPKFAVKQELDAEAQDQKTKGDRNREKVLAAIGSEWVSKKQVVEKTQLSASTVGSHLKALLLNGRIKTKGSNRSTLYRLA